METASALQWSFSSLSSRSRYPHLHQRNPTLHYTWAHFGPLRLTGASTNTALEHKNSFSILAAMSRRQQFDGYYPAYIVDEFLVINGQYFSKDRQVFIDEARQQPESHTIGPIAF